MRWKIKTSNARSDTQNILVVRVPAGSTWRVPYVAFLAAYLTEERASALVDEIDAA